MVITKTVNIKKVQETKTLKNCLRIKNKLKKIGTKILNPKKYIKKWDECKEKRGQIESPKFRIRKENNPNQNKQVIDSEKIEKGIYIFLCPRSYVMWR